jgi:phage shock protein E
LTTNSAKLEFSRQWFIVNRTTFTRWNTHLKKLLLSLLSIISFSSFAGDLVEISAQQLNSSNTENWLILDVRTKEEFLQGHVPGAINIAHDQISDNLDKLLGYKDKPVVVYCRSGFRAAKAAKILMSEDFQQVNHLEGDMLGWEKSGFDIEKD